MVARTRDYSISKMGRMLQDVIILLQSPARLTASNVLRPFSHPTRVLLDSYRALYQRGLSSHTNCDVCLEAAYGSSYSSEFVPEYWAVNRRPSLGEVNAMSVLSTPGRRILTMLVYFILHPPSCYIMALLTSRQEEFGTCIS